MKKQIHLQTFSKYRFDGWYLSCDDLYKKLGSYRVNHHLDECLLKTEFKYNGKRIYTIYAKDNGVLFTAARPAVTCQKCLLIMNNI